jgi:endoglucanase
MSRLHLIKKLTLTPGISGHESPIAEIMRSVLNDFECNRDGMGSLVFQKPGTAENPKILFIAHMDEVGFMVRDIEASGFIRIQPIGGWDPNTLLSSPVEVINRQKRRIPGIIGSVPVHFQKGGSGKPAIEEMFVDIGAIDKQDVIENFGIALGDPIVPICNFHFSEENRRIMSKAFDDRLGVAAVCALGDELKEETHPNTLLLAGSVQEEVGTRGAQTIANYTDADVCFVLEGAPADDIPGIPGNSQTAVGKGAHVRVYDPTMIAKAELRNFVIECAEKNDIPIQLTVRRGGGTDGRQIHTAQAGIPTIVLGCPVRFAHSHNCLSSLDDFDALMALLKAIVQTLDAEALEAIRS